ncbi:MAG TPA: glycosyltransferase family 1 protein [Opitutaceae bacterium]
MLLIDLTHTSHTRARTGVQRVCRSLYFSGKNRGQLLGCTYDRFAQRWRELREWENANLVSEAPATKRGAQWRWSARWRGRLERWTGAANAALPQVDGLIVPEIFSAETAQAFSHLFPQISGPKVAVFHDAIALKFPELTPAKTVARFPGYLQELRQFDGVAAVSEDSRQTLLSYWEWLGLKETPIVRTLQLGAPKPVVRPPSSRLTSSRMINAIQILCVGSIEGRKNHIALLDAAETLWEKGLTFQLQLIGLAHAETGRAALEKISSLQQAGRPLQYDGAVDEAALERSYASCDFTVYPSLMEGFGLPVLESIHHGKPCLCSSRGALGEAARGGGCMTCDPVDAESLARAMESLINDPVLRKKLADEAAARPGRGWDDYADELLAFISELRREPAKP